MQRSTKPRHRHAGSSRLNRLPLTVAIYLAFGSAAWAQTALPDQTGRPVHIVNGGKPIAGLTS